MFRTLDKSRHQPGSNPIDSITQITGRCLENVQVSTNVDISQSQMDNFVLNSIAKHD